MRSGNLLRSLIFSGISLFLLGPDLVLAGIHAAPVIIPAFKIREIASHPIKMYRVFRTNKDGTAEQIPFQIDEINQLTDYVLPYGPVNNASTGNGVFDRKDEISFMGNDVGELMPPTKWPVKKPPIIYELKISKREKTGAVYIGVYFSAPPPPSERNYVLFNLDQAEVTTSRFHYRFDKKNYLVVRGIDLKKKDGVAKPIINSSTFYLKADLKYFLTFEINHQEIESKLEAYNVGPVRAIVRVSFSYAMLKLNVDLGMYTEVSFFSNAVILPAVMYNPLDGGKSLNQGSGFYYGFNVVDNPSTISMESNMPNFQKTDILEFLSGKRSVDALYWVTANTPDYMIYMEISPSTQMRKIGNVPMLYREDISPEEFIKRDTPGAKPLGKSPVNLGMYFDLTRFDEGEHIVAFRLFFENIQDKERLAEFKEVTLWEFETKRL
jgi:hypothetical protein